MGKPPVTFKTWFVRARLPVLALFLSCVAWFLVHSGQTVKEEREIPILYKNLPPQLAFTRRPPEVIRLSFIGVFHRLRAADLENLKYEVDLTEARAGSFPVEVNTGQFFLPVDIELMNPRPRRFELLLEARSIRDVPVELKPVGTLPEGMAITKLEAKPNPVTVEGPMSAVSKLEKFHIEVPLRTGETQWTEIFNLPPTSWMGSRGISVEVEVELSKLTSEFEFVDLPVRSASPTVEIKTFPSTAKVYIQGTESSLASLKDRLYVEIPVEGLAKGRYRLEGRVPLDPGFRLIRIEPKSFIVEVLK